MEPQSLSFLQSWPLWSALPYAPWHGSNQRGPAHVRQIWQEPRLPGEAPCCWPTILPCPGSSAAAHLGQEKWLRKRFPARSDTIFSSQGPSAGLAPFSHSAHGLKGCVCKHQSPTHCLQGSGPKAREGSKRGQTVLRGCGVRSPPWRGHALQLIAMVAGVTYSTSRSQHYCVAP